MRCNNRDCLLDPDSLWKFHFFWKPMYDPVEHL